MHPFQIVALLMATSPLWVLGGYVLLGGLWGRRREEGSLRTFAACLEGGALHERPARSRTAPRLRVSGSFAGYPLRVLTRNQDGRRERYVILELSVPRAAMRRFKLEARTNLDATVRARQRALGDVELAGRVTRGQDELLALCDRLPALREALLALVAPGLGFREVSLADGTLRVVKRLSASDLSMSFLGRVGQALVRVAAQLGGRELDIVVGGRSRRAQAWAPRGNLRCPYCHDGLDPAGDLALAPCSRCDTVHHAACLEEGGCAILGCEAPANARAERTVPA